MDSGSSVCEDGTPTIALSEALLSQPSVDELCENPKLCIKLESVADILGRKDTKYISDDEDSPDLEKSITTTSGESIRSDGAVVGGDNGVAVCTGNTGIDNPMVRSNEKQQRKEVCNSDQKSESVEVLCQVRHKGEHPIPDEEKNVESSRPLRNPKETNNALPEEKKVAQEEKAVCGVDESSKTLEEDGEQTMNQLKCRGAFIVLGIVVFAIIATLMSVTIMKKMKSPSLLSTGPPSAPSGTNIFNTSNP